MNKPEPMKNLWTISGRTVTAYVIHSDNMAGEQSAPTQNHIQFIDMKKHFEVIPLPWVSY